MGSRLAAIASTLRRIGDGKYAVTFPEAHTGDEVGDFARTLQDVCDELKERERVHGTFAKLKNRRIKTKIQDGKITLKGERLKAMVLHCQLHGIEPVIAQGEPELLLTTLNKFNQSVCDAIEGRNGVVDHIHGGSIIAYWGVPLTDENDADNALATALEIREFGRTLNENLKRARLPQIALAMGLHFGPVVCGQIGTAERLEYTVLGEALEVASRIQGFTEQFGTDFLMTTQAASRAPEWYTTEKVASGDENTPELHELVGSVVRGEKADQRVSPRLQKTRTKRRRRVARIFAIDAEATGRFVADCGSRVSALRLLCCRCGGGNGWRTCVRGAGARLSILAVEIFRKHLIFS